MAKILGIGGVFFKTRDRSAVRDWYARVLGLEVGEWGAFFPAGMLANRPGAGSVFSPLEADTEYFAPSAHEFMFNLVVDDLDGMLARCREAGVEPLATMLDDPNGRFAHIVDCEGRKIELWEPIASPPS